MLRRSARSFGCCARGNTITGISRSSPQLWSRRRLSTGGRRTDSRYTLPVRIHDVLASSCSLCYKFAAVAAVLHFQTLAGPTLRCRPPGWDPRLGRTPHAGAHAVPAHAALTQGARAESRPRSCDGRWCAPSLLPAGGGLLGATRRLGGRRGAGRQPRAQGAGGAAIVFLGPRRSRAAGP